MDGDKDGTAGGNYTFSFSTKPARINVTDLTHEYYDGYLRWVRAGTKTVTAQLVDDNGNPILSNMPPQLAWKYGGGSSLPVVFASTGTTATTWIGKINVPSGSDGGANFLSTNGMPVSGIITFAIDTKPPVLDPFSVSKPSCNCPQGPAAIGLNASDAGSGIDEIEPVGLGLFYEGCLESGNHRYGASTLRDKVGNNVSRVALYAQKGI